MTNRKERVERRKHKRFEIPIGMFVSFRPHRPRLGEVINISRGGLAFRYYGGKEPSDGSNKLNIFLEEGDFHLNDILSRTVTDFGTYRIPFRSVTMRRSSVQFRSLTHHQISQLEHFIENYAIGEA
ncbi:MAG: PilZ domain-containing protein [Deltaproteobacteria bacterium]|nr:PilZ domain-containing protein [Deltaproteobacteria bacterium]MBW2567139.1 PilZ domain-containing protein [Deltaproteobacteria bacterium]